MASENIDALLMKRKIYRITDDMLKNVPRKGDNHPMKRTYGPGWIAWQDVWLSGLRGLRDQDVYVLSNSEAFYTKFKVNTTRDVDNNNYFSPSYQLPAGSQARCILDWERIQIKTHAEKNNLTIKHVKARIGKYTNFGFGGKPHWYKDAPTNEEFAAGYWFYGGRFHASDEVEMHRCDPRNK